MPICRLDPPDHRPHRRGRGDRAAGGGDQGTGRERARRRGERDRGRDRSRRQTADPGRRRRTGHGRSRSRALRRAARDVENSRRRPDRDRDLRLPRRGAAVDRLGVAARNPHPRGGRADGPEARGRGRDQERHRTLGRAARRAGRGARSLRRHARAAQVPQVRPVGSGGRGRRGQAARDGRAAGALLVCDRHRLSLRLARRGRGRSGPCRAAAPGAGRRLCRELGRARRAPRRRCGLPAASACRPSAGRTLPSSSCSSMGGRCATRRSPARCAAPISISCPPTGTRSPSSSSSATRAKSTSTSTRRKPKCAFATQAPFAALSSERSSSA